jgi:hypothetical protein
MEHAFSVASSPHELAEGQTAEHPLHRTGGGGSGPSLPVARMVRLGLGGSCPQSPSR